MKVPSSNSTWSIAAFGPVDVNPDAVRAGALSLSGLGYGVGGFEKSVSSIRTLCSTLVTVIVKF